MSDASDWLHLKAYGYAPGNYMSRCHRCNKTISGLDKRAISCRPCAESLHQQFDLLACPFCGGHAESHPVGDRGYWRTGCRNAVSCGHQGPALPSRVESAESWNRRSNAPAGTIAAAPLHWRCFHCNFVARTQAEAVEHFGSVMNERPAACLIPDNYTEEKR